MPPIPVARLHDDTNLYLLSIPVGSVGDAPEIIRKHVTKIMGFLNNGDLTDLRVIQVVNGDALVELRVKDKQHPRKD